MKEIINPIYDASFKYLMEDDRAAKTLLSALLRRRVLKITPKPHEHVDRTQDRKTGKDLGIYRLDYSATVETEGGGTEAVSIELQKVWLESEIYRFRKYLGGQYSDVRNMDEDGVTPHHIIAIYILGHTISETDSPIAYGFGGSLLDYDGRPLELGKGSDGLGSGKFVSGLTHDIIIVQVPRLPEKPRNAAERVLAAFDQRRARSDDRHVIELPDDCAEGAFGMRLRLGLADSRLRETVEIEEEIQWELDSRYVKIEKLEQANREKDEQIARDRQELEQKGQELEQKGRELENYKRASVMALRQAGLGAEAIAATLGLEEEYVRLLLK